MAALFLLLGRSGAIAMGRSTSGSLIEPENAKERKPIPDAIERRNPQTRNAETQFWEKPGFSYYSRDRG
jgi:hypothetical protein